MRDWRYVTDVTICPQCFIFNNIVFVIIECGEMITISIVYILYTKLKQIVYQCINYVAWKRWPIQSAKCRFFVSKLKSFYFFWRVVLNWPQIMKVNLLVRVKCVFRTHVRQFCVQAINFQWKYTYFYFLTLSISSWNCPEVHVLVISCTYPSR